MPTSTHSNSSSPVGVTAGNVTVINNPGTRKPPPAADRMRLLLIISIALCVSEVAAWGYSSEPAAADPIDTPEEVEQYFFSKVSR